jgi:hypothetical protein
MYVGPDLTNEDLVFGYDTGYGIANNSTATRFCPGEPTTNLQSSNQTSGQIAGMQGVGLTYVGEENGYSKYSMSGTFSAGTYPYCMYLPGVSFSGGTAYSTQVELKTNVPNKFNYIGGGINYVNQPMNSAGTNSSVLQSDGFNYIRREGFNYVSTTAQSGYIHSNPVNNTTFNSSTDFIYVKHFQIEQNTHSTPWTPTSRSSTEGLLDLTGTFDIDLSNMSFNSTAQPTFNGTNNAIQVSSSVFNKSGSDPITVECIMKPGRLSPYQAIVVNRSNSTYNWMLYQHTNDGSIQLHGAAQNKSTYVPVVGNYIHVVATVDSSNNMVLYVNGEVKQTVSSFAYQTGQPGALSIGRFGTASEPYLGDIPVVKFYDITLTAAQVASNFNAYKNRFNL